MFSSENRVLDKSQKVVLRGGQEIRAAAEQRKPHCKLPYLRAHAVKAAMKTALSAESAQSSQPIQRALKPGGKVLITMYGVGHGTLSEHFKQYVSQRQYYLRNLQQIEEIAKKTGFTDIETENMTPRFKEILLEERQRVEQNKDEFLEKFSQKEYDSLVNGWNSKLQYIADDNHNWNFFAAVKPH
ncbi:hypothetical protein COOONC_14654 [Cooperia oncophora]